LRDGNPNGEVQDCWVAEELGRDIYLTDDTTEAERALDDAIAWCTAPQSGRELGRLAKTLRRWRREILAHHAISASNQPVEAANLLIEQHKRPGRGFRNLDNYRLRILLAGGLTRDPHTVTRLRARPRAADPQAPAMTATGAAAWATNSRPRAVRIFTSAAVMLFPGGRSPN